MNTPLVSVVTATYNRSHVLCHAIASLVRSDFQDWEQIVVGDACTDDTAEVVAAFNDPRIRFLNLSENIGEQSGPNNEGCRLARGRYIAFLNHDDLWFPDHLQTLIERLETEKADLVYARGISILPDGLRILMGPSFSGKYQPLAEVHASLWLHHRRLLDEVGPWRHSRQCRAVPSQDWLIRAWKNGKKILPSDRVTVLAVHASYYKDCYLSTGSPIHDELMQGMLGQPGFRESEVTRAALDAQARLKSIEIGIRLKGLMRALLYRALFVLGLPPVEVKYFFTSFFRRGGYIDRIRRFRGLPVKSRKRKGEK